MPDQADKLRELVHGAAPCAEAELPTPPMIVVTGGKGGVGATTVALNLAVALTHRGHRTVLVDLAPHADAANLADVDTSSGPCLADVMAGTATAADALRPGPEGISLLAGRWAADIRPERSAQALEKLLRNLGHLTNHADVLVVDAGSGTSNWSCTLWRRAALVLLVTTAGDVAIMDCYATIKRGVAESDVAPPIHLLVNQCDDASAATDAERRIATACRRFLGRRIGRAPRLPRDGSSSQAHPSSPRGWETPRSLFGRSVGQLGRFIDDVLSQHRSEPELADSEIINTRELAAC